MKEEKQCKKLFQLEKESMIAVLGLKINEIKKLIKNTKIKENGVCEIANDNADGQVIISGDKKSVEFLKNYS